jgi:hypothetical protein
MDDLREFIATARWLFAKTMAAYNPHWYVVEREEAGPLFDRFVAFVRSGPIRRYRCGRYHCVTERLTLVTLRPMRANRPDHGPWRLRGQGRALDSPIGDG